MNAADVFRIRRSTGRGQFTPWASPAQLRRKSNRQLISLADAVLAESHELVVTTAADLARYQHDVAAGALPRRGGAR